MNQVLDVPTEVRVTKTGNSRALPIPASIARDLGADPGDPYELEVIGNCLLYRPTGSGHGKVAFDGTGGERTFQPLGERVAILRETGASIGLLDDWDF